MLPIWLCTHEERYLANRQPSYQDFGLKGLWFAGEEQRREDWEVERGGGGGWAGAKHKECRGKAQEQLGEAGGRSMGRGDGGGEEIQEGVGGDMGASTRGGGFPCCGQRREAPKGGGEALGSSYEAACAE